MTYDKTLYYIVLPCTASCGIQYCCLSACRVSRRVTSHHVAYRPVTSNCKACRHVRSRPVDARSHPTVCMGQVCIIISHFAAGHSPFRGLSQDPGSCGLAVYGWTVSSSLCSSCNRGLLCILHREHLVDGKRSRHVVLRDINTTMSGDNTYDSVDETHHDSRQQKSKESYELNMYVCVSVCIHMCICIYIYIHICYRERETYMCVCIYIYVLLVQ